MKITSPKCTFSKFPHPHHMLASHVTSGLSTARTWVWWLLSRLGPSHSVSEKSKACSQCNVESRYLCEEYLKHPSFFAYDTRIIPDHQYRIFKSDVQWILTQHDQIVGLKRIRSFSGKHSTATHAPSKTCMCINPHGRPYPWNAFKMEKRYCHTTSSPVTNRNPTSHVNCAPRAFQMLDQYYKMASCNDMMALRSRILRLC